MPENLGRSESLTILGLPHTNMPKRWDHHFVTNWVRAPFAGLRISLIVVLFDLLDWPAWMIHIIPAFRFDLTNRKTDGPTTQRMALDLLYPVSC